LTVQSTTAIHEIICSVLSFSVRWICIIIFGSPHDFIGTEDHGHGHGHGGQTGSYPSRRTNGTTKAKRPSDCSKTTGFSTPTCSAPQDVCAPCVAAQVSLARAFPHATRPRVRALVSSHQLRTGRGKGRGPSWAPKLRFLLISLQGGAEWCLGFALAFSPSRRARLGSIWWLVAWCSPARAGRKGCLVTNLLSLHASLQLQLLQLYALAWFYE
jgi:hypothetical protein